MSATHVYKQTDTLEYGIHYHLELVALKNQEAEK